MVVRYSAESIRSNSGETFTNELILSIQTTPKGHCFIIGMH